MKKKKKKTFKKIYLILFVILVPTLILLYSHYIGVKGMETREYKIRYTNLHEDFYGLKIAHVSDIYYGKNIHIKELKKLVNKINKTKPDIIVFTGDFINVSITDAEKSKIIETLKELDTNIGSYYVRGDNDSDLTNIILKDSGFFDLDDNYDLIYTNSNESIMLAGLSSGNTNIDKFNEFLNENKPNYNILIMHEPDLIDKFDYSKFNLILAGHTLGGQIKIPYINGIIKQKNGKKYWDNNYTLKNTTLYVSSGIGTDKYNFRLFNHPSFNLYRLSN